GRACFGYRFASFEDDRPHPFVPAMNRALNYANLSLLPPWVPVRRLVAGSPRQNAADVALMNRTVDDVIETRSNGSTAGAGGLLDRMRAGAHPDNGQRLDLVNVRRQIITFIIAGHETTSGALSFALYYLSKDPQALAAAYAEVDAVWGSSADPEPT